MIPFSVLDLAPIIKGGTARQAFDASRDLAQHAERLGYKRYWLAEHHNMPGIASAATSLVIAHVAAGTQTIRVGSGGIMLPNHSPLVIAEQFGTLEALYPGRIDLGLGRAPGTDQMTARALRRGAKDSSDHFPQDVQELQAYFEPVAKDQAVQAVPGGGLNVPIWLLGSSLFSAQLAGMLGLPFTFASHFAPDLLLQALDIYRREFQPSESLEKPYAMAAINVFAADTEAEAKRAFTSLQQSFISLRFGTPGQFPPPVDNIEEIASPAMLAGVQSTFREAAVGDPAQVEKVIKAFIEKTKVDELMITGMMYDHAARKRSFEIAAQVRERLADQEL
jgi:luciferase family oxidoreductase group 1